MKFKYFLFFFFFILFATVNGWAGQFAVDPAYTNVSFRIKHLMGFAVGDIKKYEGKITLDEDNAKLTGLEATLDMTSLDTKHKDRDEDLKSDRFFDTAKFPTAFFKVKLISDKELTADLTLKGVTKEVKLSYVFLGVASDQYGRVKTALQISGKINRKDFGITYNTKTDDGKWLLGDDVELKVDVEGVLEK